MPWLVGAIMSAILGALFSQSFRTLLEDVFYTIMYFILTLVAATLQIYKDYVRGLFEQVLGVLPGYVSIPVTELHLIDLLNIYLTLLFVRRLLRL